MLPSFILIIILYHVILSLSWHVRNISNPFSFQIMKQIEGISLNRDPFPYLFAGTNLG